MTRDDMLARLLAQAEGDGADLVTLRAIVEEAADMGAERALNRLHLDDDAAVADMAELMAMETTTNPLPPAALHELKAWLRIDTAQEDTLLYAQIRAAVDMAGRFMGQPLLATDCAEEIPATTGWQRLSMGGVLSITGALNAADDAPLSPAAWEMDIDRHGAGWVRLASLAAPEGIERVRILYRAGLARQWDAVPEALRQGVIRYAAHLYATRDVADADPPAAVTAFWRPWKRVTL